MIDRTLKYILGEKKFKTLGSSRTDSMVSANHSYFEIFLEEALNETSFLEEFNQNLPADIRAIDIYQMDEKFNIIQCPKTKEYLYLFSFGSKIHPFCAPYMTAIREELDIEIMKEGAKLFEGMHNFQQYSYKPTEQTVFNREVDLCEIKENTVYTANFFPKKSYLMRVKGKGFLRYQIRIMMGALFNLGKGDMTLEDLENSLQPGTTMPFVAPASGLILNEIEFDITL